MKAIRALWFALSGAEFHDSLVVYGGIFPVD